MSPTAVRAAVMAAAALSLTACSIEETMPSPSCDRSGSIIIVAQSVPSATQVPCVEALPGGWSAATVRIDEEGTRIRFEEGRSRGRSAQLTFSASCEAPGGDGRADDSVQPVRFAGGCLTWEFASAVPETEREQIIAAVDLVERRLVERDIRRSFVDEEL